MIHTSDSTGYSLVRSHAGFLPPRSAIVKDDRNGLRMEARAKYKFLNTLKLPERGELVIGVQPGYGIRDDNFDINGNPIFPSSCIAPYFATMLRTGSSDGTVRYSFTPIAGRRLAFWVGGADDEAFLNLYGPDGTTLLASDSNDTGVDFGVNSANSVVYTFPDAQTYFIDVACQSQTDYRLTVSDAPSILATADAQWMMIYVPQTRRIFTIGSYKAGIDAVATCIDSVNFTIVNQVILKAGNLNFTPTTRVLFYRPNDNAVWCFTRDNDGTNNQAVLLNATTGAIISQTPLAADSSLVNGVYSPTDDLVYCSIETPGDTSLTHISAFSPASLAVVHAYAMPFPTTAVASLSYDADTGRTYALTPSSANANDVRHLWTFVGGVASEQTISARMGSMEFPLVHDGFMYGTNPPGPGRDLLQLDLTSLIVTNIADRCQYTILHAAWDECIDCLGVVTGGSRFEEDGIKEIGSFARATDAGLVLGSSRFETNAFGDFVTWAKVVWNPDRSRLVLMGVDSIYEV